MGSGFSSSLTNTINGAGLSLFGDLAATHDGTIPSNSWVSSSLILTGNLDFDLGGLFFVDGFSFWNQNSGGPGFFGSTGIQDVIVLSSLDGSNYNPIPEAPLIFAQQTGFSNVPPEMFSFSRVTASHIRFEIRSNWGDNAQTGFAEVAFSGVAVPEPATFLMLGFAVSGGLAFRLTRRSLRSRRLAA